MPPVEDRWCTRDPRQPVGRVAEGEVLAEGEFLVALVHAGEVRRKTFDDYVGQAAYFFGERHCLGREEAVAVEAGLNLDVNGRLFAGPDGGLGERPRRLDRGNRGSQARPDRAIGDTRCDAAEDEDRRFDAVVAQHLALFDADDAEAPGARGERRPRDGGGAVPVGVTLDDDQQLRRPRLRFQRPDVGLDPVQVDLSPDAEARAQRPFAGRLHGRFDGAQGTSAQSAGSR